VNLPDLRQDEAIVARVREYYRQCYGPITPHWQKLADDVLNLDRERERIGKLESDLGLSLRGRRLLEIGSGFGLFVLAAHAAGASVGGVEPDEAACQTARMILAKGGAPPSSICRAAGEALPFADRSFDAICSFQVLEHTRDPQAVLAEALRVTRPGGVLYFVVPNYNSFWESHYGLLWLPRLNKRVGKGLLRLLRRDPAFLDSIQYITPARLRRILARIETPHEVLSWGVQTWRQRLLGRDMTRWGQTGPLLRVLRIAHALRLTRLVAWAGEKLESYYPIILVLHRM